MFDAHLVTRIVATGQIVATKTVRNLSHQSILDRAQEATLAVARRYDQPPDTFTTKATILGPDPRPLDPLGILRP